MKHYRTITATETREILFRRTCDLCEQPMPEWPNDPSYFDYTESDGSFLGNDVCPPCFIHKIRPALIAIGLKMDEHEGKLLMPYRRL